MRHQISGIVCWALCTSLVVGQAANHDPDKDSGSKKIYENSIGMKLAKVPAGEFEMGNVIPAEKLSERFSGKPHLYEGGDPQHVVRITRDFYIGVHEVTVGQFRQFVEATRYKTEAETDGVGGGGFDSEGKRQQSPTHNWRHTGFEQTDQHPVVNVTWNDAVAFCDWLTLTEGRKYRLPTEAEWEYACRAGTSTMYQHGDDMEPLSELGNVFDASLRKERDLPERIGIRADDGHAYTASVGTYKPNAWGIFDMHGNVQEWCADWYNAAYYDIAPRNNPLGPLTGNRRVVRDGFWGSFVSQCRSAKRSSGEPAGREAHLGFRVVCESQPQAEPVDVELAQILQALQNRFLQIRDIPSLHTKCKLHYEHVQGRKAFAYDKVKVSSFRKGEKYRVDFHGYRQKEDQWIVRKQMWTGTQAISIEEPGHSDRHMFPNGLMYHFDFYLNYQLFADGHGPLDSRERVHKHKDAGRWLPDVFLYNHESYVLRPEMEEMNGRICFVLEIPYYDILWVDPTREFALVRRDLYRDQDSRKTRTDYSDFRLVGSLWFPFKIVREYLGQTDRAKEFEDKVCERITLVVDKLDLSQIDDKKFEVEFEPGDWIIDQFQQKQYIQRHSQ